MQIPVGYLKPAPTDKYLVRKINWDLRLRNHFNGCQSFHGRLPDLINLKDIHYSSTMNGLEKIISIIRDEKSKEPKHRHPLAYYEKRWRQRESVVHGVLGDALLNLDEAHTSRLWSNIAGLHQEIINPTLWAIPHDKEDIDKPALYADMIIKGENALILIEIKSTAQYKPEQALKYLRLYNAFKNSDVYRGMNIAHCIIAPLGAKKVFSERAEWLHAIPNDWFTAQFRHKAFKNVKRHHWYRELKTIEQCLFDALPIRLVSFSSIYKHLQSLKGDNTRLLNAKDAIKYLENTLEKKKDNS